MIIRKKIQYISDEHKDARRGIVAEIEANNPIATGSLPLAKFEQYIGLRDILINADRSYASQLPKENPNSAHLELAERLYKEVPADILFK